MDLINVKICKDQEIIKKGKDILVSIEDFKTFAKKISKISYFRYFEMGTISEIYKNNQICNMIERLKNIKDSINKFNDELEGSNYSKINNLNFDELKKAIQDSDKIFSLNMNKMDRAMNNLIDEIIEIKKGTLDILNVLESEK